MPVINFTPGGYNFFVTAEMRAYMQALHDALLDAGLEQTEDTGQIDLETVESTANSTSGYFGYSYPPLLYKWPGSNGYPDLYLRMFFSIANAYGDNTCHVPAMVITVGTGTDGAGELTGTVLSVMPTVLALQTGNSFTDSMLPGVVAFDDSFLSVCVNPGQHSSGANHLWGLPFFCIERQQNGDYHCTTVTMTGDIRYVPAPTATPGIMVASCIDGVAANLPIPCAFIDGPTVIDGGPVIQKVYRHDRDSAIAEFSPLVAIHHTTALWSTVDIDLGDHVRIYMSCGPNSGNRITTTVPNTWIPAMRLA